MRKWLLLALVGIVVWFVLSRREGVNGTLTSATSAAPPPSYAESTGYAALAAAVHDTNNGPLPAPINETATPGDTDVRRPGMGPVFSNDGPFSGQAGTGQGSGENAANGMAPNSYGPPGENGKLNPFDFYPTGKPKVSAPSAPAAPAGTKLPIKGPSYGGRGVAVASSSSGASSSKPAPTLYGPTAGGGQNMGWGHPRINSGDTSALPSDASAGSDPSNMFAATSRVPGDMDLFPNPYIQSTTYSLANGSQKTDPVPFLTDFSAFQK